MKSQTDSNAQSEKKQTKWDYKSGDNLATIINSPDLEFYVSCKK